MTLVFSQPGVLCTVRDVVVVHAAFLLPVAPVYIAALFARVLRAAIALTYRRVRAHPLCYCV